MGTRSSTRDPRATRGRRGRGRTMLVLGVGLLVALAAWAALVYVAIGFGSSARDGETSGWVFLALAAVGAVICLFAALLLGVRLVAVARGRVAPRRGGGHRR